MTLVSEGWSGAEVQTLRVRPFVLAGGIALYTATQARFGGLPVGLGELLLLSWMGLAAFDQFTGRGRPIHPIILRFWIAIAVSLSIGLLIGFAIEDFQYWRGIFHDVFALTFVGCFSMALVAEMSSKEDRDRTVRLLCWFTGAAIIVQASALTPVSLLRGFDEWEYHRLKGWSENPNQLGLFAAFVILLSVRVIESATGHAQRIAAAAIIAVSIMVGFATDSDTFAVGMLGAGAVYAVIALVAFMRSGSPRAISVAYACLTILLATGMLLLLVKDVRDSFDIVEEKVSAMYSKSDQGEERFALWAEAIEKGFSSYLLGLGPGPHLLEKSWKEPPPKKFETHNSVLELLVQGGIPAVSAFVLLVGYAFFQAARTGLASGAAIIIGLLLFSAFHHILRHPLFWVGIVLVIIEAEHRLVGLRVLSNRSRGIR